MRISNMISMDFVQEIRNPSALAIELRLSCTNPWICEINLVIKPQAKNITWNQNLENISD